MPISMKKSFLNMTDEERRSLARRVLEERKYFSALTDKGHQSLVRWVLEMGGEDGFTFKALLLENYFGKLTYEERRPLVHWALGEGYWRCDYFLMEEYFPDLTNEERRPLVLRVLKEGFDQYKRLLVREQYFSYLTDEEHESLVRWWMTKRDNKYDLYEYRDHLHLLKNYFPYLTHDECKKVVSRLLAIKEKANKINPNATIDLLESCFCKPTPAQFHVIIDIIVKPFLDLSFASFYQIAKKADAELIALFLGKYHQKLTDGQFATMIQKVGTMRAEQFLKNHFPQLKAPRFSLVIAMCSLDGMVTFLEEYALTLNQRQVIRQRAGDLFEF
jgi:hypothetical protein